MNFLYHWLIPALWFSFWGYWLIAARRVKKTKQSEPRPVRIIYLLLLTFCFLLVGAPEFHRGFLGHDLLLGGSARFLIGVAIVITGLSFAVWARLHLGENWSGVVTLKEGHALICSGPYRFVRHPIYTGMLFGLLGTAFALGEVRGFLALGIFWVMHIFKSQREERLMIQEFGDEYVQYRKQVPALVPFTRFLNP
jgi:protein-S-isoprenylcysteine O-methyltransferase Ste14